MTLTTDGLKTVSFPEQKLQMQPPCSLHLGTSLTFGSQSSAGSFQEKQLFEKFWKGTFKAVATPRPESVIVASITSGRRVNGSDINVCPTLKPAEQKGADSRVDGVKRNGCVKRKGRKRHSRRRFRSPSYDDDLSPRPKVKKKKRKSVGKRKRKRSPSPSLSPLRKKKKKRKKSSKKSKRHRYSSKKSKHSSSGLKHKRKDERKQKKSSRTHSKRRRRYRRSESDTSSCRSATEDRHLLQKSVVHQVLGQVSAAGEVSSGEFQHTDLKWRSSNTSECKKAPKYRSILSTCTILSTQTRGPPLKGSGDPSRQMEGHHDYDSGNDTSSPPSSKTGVSRTNVTEDRNNLDRRFTSPEKLRFSDRDSVSDSGNSVTSYTSLCKPYREDSSSGGFFNGNERREPLTLGCHVQVLRSQSMSLSPQHRRSTSRGSRCSSSRNSRCSERYSRSPSLSTCSSYSRSPSYSSHLRRRGSVGSQSSRGSYSRHSSERLRDRKRKSSYRKTDSRKHSRKVSRKRRRRRSFSPMKKRRRDSPSHLEARRITSARKRPIPYFRPSPSTSCRSTSVSSWSSLFTRSRSRSPIYSTSRSRSRSRSWSPCYSSYHSYSRSSSFNSIFGARSRSHSHSCGLLNKRKRKRH